MGDVPTVLLCIHHIQEWDIKKGVIYTSSKLPKDNVSLSTAPTNVIHHYPPTQDKGSPYDLGDHI